MQPQQNKPGITKRILLVILFGLIGVGLLRYTQIQDFIRLYNYTPPTSVVALSDQTTMTPKARHLFYVNHPGLYSQVDEFRQACPENTEAIVLGCYVGDQKGISIYQIVDPALVGVQQTTAAHEMLHAAYDRLDSKTKKRVNTMLQNFYTSGLSDASVKAEIEVYKKTEPNQLVNEMHSLFGTEVAQLPPDLETYYKQYFVNRPKVIGFYAQYQAQFTQRQQTLKADDVTLVTQKLQVDSEQASLQQRKSKITSDRSRINGYAESNDIAAYNAAVPVYNSEVDSYNMLVQQLSIHIDTYNRLVAERNAVASQLAALDKSLDTRTVQSVQP